MSSSQMRAKVSIELPHEHFAESRSVSRRGIKWSAVMQKKLLLSGPTSEPLLYDDSHRLPAVGASVGMRLLNLEA